MDIKTLFGVDKPVIGMVHFLPMPTDPKYDNSVGLKPVIERARREVLSLQNGGIDGILFCNEYSIPYVENVRTVTVACMARIIGELLCEIKVPFGVDVALDPFKVFDLASATGADFVRETLSGAYSGNYGLQSIPQGEVERHRYDVGCGNVLTFTTLMHEGVSPLVNRPVEEVAKSIEFAIHPSAFMVYSVTSGSEIDLSYIKKAKEVTDVPLFASNGVKAETIASILEVADGCIVGTSIKRDGIFDNEIDESRVRNLMKKARCIKI
jgi:membrane complex biogenesis BtpA family protein